MDKKNTTNVILREICVYFIKFCTTDSSVAILAGFVSRFLPNGMREVSLNCGRVEVNEDINRSAHIQYFLKRAHRAETYNMEIQVTRLNRGGSRFRIQITLKLIIHANFTSKLFYDKTRILVWNNGMVI